MRHELPATVPLQFFHGCAPIGTPFVFHGTITG